MSNRPDLLKDVTGKVRASKRRALWRRARWYLLGVGIAALAGLLVWLVGFSQVFVAREVEVEGTSLVSVDEVRTAAQVPLGLQLIRIDTSQITERVAALPAVEGVKVSTSWPGTVRIAVTERTAVYQRFEFGTYSWVDAKGVVFHQTQSAQKGLPIAYTATADARLLRDVAVTITVLSPELRERLVKVTASSPDNLVLDIGDGARVIWGSAGRGELKSQVATALLQVKARTYDVSAPDSPITKP